MLVKTLCEKVRESLAGVADGTIALDEEERDHLETCLRCQADLAQHRKVLRGLQNLGSEVRVPPPELLGEVLARLDDAEDPDARTRRTGRRAAYIGGIAAATAAGAAGAALLAARSRKLKIAS